MLNFSFKILNCPRNRFWTKKIKKNPPVNLSNWTHFLWPKSVKRWESFQKSTDSDDNSTATKEWEFEFAIHMRCETSNNWNTSYTNSYIYTQFEQRICAPLSNNRKWEHNSYALNLAKHSDKHSWKRTTWDVYGIQPNIFLAVFFYFIHSVAFWDHFVMYIISKQSLILEKKCMTNGQISKTTGLTQTCETIFYWSYENSNKYYNSLMAFIVC